MKVLVFIFIFLPSVSFAQFPSSSGSSGSSFPSSRSSSSTSSWSSTGAYPGGSYPSGAYSDVGSSRGPLRLQSAAATSCPFIPSSDVNAILADVKTALQAKSSDAQCNSLNQGAALLDGALRRSIELGFMRQDQGYGGVNCTNYTQMYTQEMNYILTAQSKNIPYNSNILSSNCYFQGNQAAYQDCLEFAVTKAIDTERLSCENQKTQREANAKLESERDLYQQGLSAAVSMVSGSSGCEDKNVARQVLRLGVGSFANMAASSPIGLAAVAGAQLLNALIDRFSNRSAHFIKDMNDEETLANLQCLQLYISRRALSCDGQTFQPRVQVTTACQLSPDQFGNLQQISNALDTVSAVKSQEHPNEATLSQAMSLLSDSIQRQTVNKDGKPVSLAALVDTKQFSSPKDAEVKSFFDHLKNGQPLPADELVALAPQSLRIRAVVESTLRSNANIDSLQRAEQYARTQSAMAPTSSETAEGDADSAFLLSAHSKFTTAFRDKFLEVLSTARQRYQANMSNDSTRVHFGMQLYRTCRLNAGAFLWGDQRGQQMSVSSPQRNPKFESLCGEFLQCNVANKKSIAGEMGAIFRLPPAQQSNAMQHMQCDLMNFQGDDLNRVRDNLKAGRPPCG